MPRPGTPERAVDLAVAASGSMLAALADVLAARGRRVGRDHAAVHESAIKVDEPA